MRTVFALLVVLATALPAIAKEATAYPQRSTGREMTTLYLNAVEATLGRTAAVREGDVQHGR